MYTWLIISVIGLVLLAFGLVVFARAYSPNKPLSHSSLFLGMTLPVLLAFFYSESVMEMIPQLTLIDIGAFFVLGLISGFFLSLLMVKRDEEISK